MIEDYAKARMAEGERSPLESASAEIANELTSLEGLVNKFEMKLQPLLRLDDKQGGEKLACIPNVSSEHVGELCKHRDYISSLRQRLGSLLERLDV